MGTDVGGAVVAAGGGADVVAHVGIAIGAAVGVCGRRCRYWGQR